MGHSRPLFPPFFRLSIQLTANKCSINFADDWIRTADLRYRKRPLHQPSHNHCPNCLLYYQDDFVISLWSSSTLNKQEFIFSLLGTRLIYALDYSIFNFLSIYQIIQSLDLSDGSWYQLLLI